jgi:hypothetical protein
MVENESRRWRQDPGNFLLVRSGWEQVAGLMLEPPEVTHDQVRLGIWEIGRGLLSDEKGKLERTFFLHVTEDHASLRVAGYSFKAKSGKNPVLAVDWNHWTPPPGNSGAWQEGIREIY